ncbi:hypothetical protein RINGS_72 [Arthrobacter phage Rings]|uniref:Uncharacterized protein n=1 Tax=Arthrobacter phage Rings TaxID=1772313 RepID=A0A0U4KA72_9CAUD|nr:hypothetical protein RINGS_72 [Arthrobacter phage Rings]
MAEFFPGDRVRIEAPEYEAKDLQSGTGTVSRRGCREGCCSHDLYEVTVDGVDNDGDTTPYFASELTKID